MKKLLSLAVIFLTLACNERGDEMSRVLVYRSYIGSFCYPCELRIHSSVGFKIDETKKLVNFSATIWSSDIDDYNDYYSVDDQICLFVRPAFVIGFEDRKSYLMGGKAENSDCDLSSLTYQSIIDLSETDKKCIYNSYIKWMGDTLYNKKYNSTDPSLIIPIKSFSIVSNKDFSQDFPAGKELNGLFTLFYDDPYATVKNKYKTLDGAYRRTNCISDIYPQSIFKQRLSDVNFPELPFITSELFCVLDVAPEKTDEYIFHVTITMSDGKVLETDAPPVRIKRSEGG